MKNCAQGEEAAEDATTVEFTIVFNAHRGIKALGQDDGMGMDGVWYPFFMSFPVQMQLPALLEPSTLHSTGPGHLLPYRGPVPAYSPYHR
jgi:hypothetical protein